MKYFKLGSKVTGSWFVSNFDPRNLGLKEKWDTYVVMRENEKDWREIENQNERE